MPSPMTKTSRSKARRSIGVTRPQPTTPINVSSASAASSVVTVTFDQVVTLKGVPKYTTDVAGADAISAEQTTPTTIEVTFDASVAAATTLNIPYEEPAVRNASGGFVSTSTFPV